MTNSSDLSVIFYTFFCSGAFLLMAGGFAFAIVYALVIAPKLKQTGKRLKGDIGESRVAWVLKDLDPEKYIVLNDILFQRNAVRENELATTQIDHVVVSVYGIFVIETKNYSGKIYGNENSPKWQQYVGKQKYYFMNPLRQNYAHTKVLSELLYSQASTIGIVGADFNIYPIVAFTGSAELKITANGADVVYYQYVPNVIQKYSQYPVLTRQQVESIARCIVHHNVNSEEKKREHIENIYNTRLK